MQFKLENVTVAAPQTKSGGGLQYTAGTHTYAAELSGAPSAASFFIDGSLDGVNWTELGNHVFTAGELSAAFAMLHITGKTVNMIRARATFTGGTDPQFDIDAKVI